MQVNSMTIGQAASCSLVLAHPTVSQWHASVELDGDGYLWVNDNRSREGTFLHRAGAWIRIGRATLCRGDSIRFGDHEVMPDQLLSLFGTGRGARLRTGARPFVALKAGQDARPDGPHMSPRRNPHTGKIEDIQP